MLVLTLNNPPHQKGDAEANSVLLAYPDVKHNFLFTVFVKSHVKCPNEIILSEVFKQYERKRDLGTEVSLLERGRH